MGNISLKHVLYIHKTTKRTKSALDLHYITCISTYVYLITIINPHITFTD